MGELGFVVPENRRTHTVECVESAEVLTISYEKLLELYFQNPRNSENKCCGYRPSGLSRILSGSNGSLR